MEEEQKRQHEGRLYHSFGVEQVGAQSVCHLCSAVVQDRDVHTIWHAGLDEAAPD